MMTSRKPQSATIVLTFLLFSQTTGFAALQNRAPLAKGDAVLVVEGVVREVFRSARQDGVDYVVQIEVKRSEYGRTPRTPVRVVMPAPGDLLYIHSSERTADGRRTVPTERSQVRAYIVPGVKGGWDGCGADWFEPTATELADASPSDPSPAAAPMPAPTGPKPASPPVGTPSAKAALVALGLTGEPLSVKGQFVLRVTSVEQGGPAQRAGLQPGDVIIGANDQRIESVDQLDQLGRQGRPLGLLVLDVNTGKAVHVPVDVAAIDPPRADTDDATQPGVKNRPPTTPATVPVPGAAARGRPLGISAQAVQVGQRTAMKVTAVVQGSPAQEAGIEIGDVIVAANGVAVTGPEALSTVLRKTGASVSLTVRDTRTARDVPVEVKLGGSDPAPHTSIPTDPQLQAGTGRKLGAVTELVFYDIDPAVKVTEVEPGSPAERAGIKVGDVIVGANGTPVLHPNTLTEIVSKSGPALKLAVIDTRTGRKTPVEVNLGTR